MAANSFKALVLEKEREGIVSSIRLLKEADLPEGDTTVSVLYSSLNYKDALAVTGAGKIIRGTYPFVPGIDLAGEVVATDARHLKAGDVVIGTGWGLGEHTWGGFSEVQRVRSEWLVPLPHGMTPEASMVIGTAGLTAMLGLMALEKNGLKSGDGDVVVTGATGGVGSLAVCLLAAEGYRVVASTGKMDQADYLRDLGASEIIPRSELGEGPKQPLMSARWAGAIDTVGGKTLAAVLSSLRRHASVAACGLGGGSDLQTTVFPFSVRGVNLLGIDSNTADQKERSEAWARMSRLLPGDRLKRISETIPLSRVPEMSRALLDGKVRGRIVVDVRAE